MGGIAIKIRVIADTAVTALTPLTRSSAMGQPLAQSRAEPFLNDLGHL
jgi:hypothetical protein